MSKQRKRLRKCGRGEGGLAPSGFACLSNSLSALLACAALLFFQVCPGTRWQGSVSGLGLLLGGGGMADDG